MLFWLRKKCIKHHITTCNESQENAIKWIGSLRIACSLVANNTISSRVPSRGYARQWSEDVVHQGASITPTGEMITHNLILSGNFWPSRDLFLKKWCNSKNLMVMTWNEICVGHQKPLLVVIHPICLFHCIG